MTNLREGVRELVVRPVMIVTLPHRGSRLKLWQCLSGAERFLVSFIDLR